MSRDFLNSWRDRVKQRNSQSAELKALQEELERTTAEIEDKINVEVDEDIHSLFSMLGQSAAETRQEIVQKIELEEYRREEAINNIVKSDKQAETLFNFLGEESSKFLAEPEEEPKIEMTEDVEDFLGTLGGVDVFAEPIEEEIVPEQEVLIDAPTQEVVEEIMDEMVEIIAEPVEPKDVISAAAEWMNQLDEIKKEPALDDLGKLTKQVELIQNQLSTYKVGWGQEGMTYGSGEVRLEYLDDVDRASVKTDGYVMKYQASSDSWIGGPDAAGLFVLLEDRFKIKLEDESGFITANELTVPIPVVSGAVSGDTMTLTLADTSTVDIDVSTLNREVVSGSVKGDIMTLVLDDSTSIDIDISQVGDTLMLLEDGFKIVLEDDTGFLMGNQVGAVVVSGAVDGNTLTLTHIDDSVTEIDVSSLNREIVSGVVSDDTLTLTLDNDTTVDIDVTSLNKEVISGAVSGDTLTLTLDNATTVDIDVSQIGDPFILQEDGDKILLEDDSGFVSANEVIVSNPVVSGDVSDDTMTLTLADTSTVDINVASLNRREVVSGETIGDVITLTQHDGSTIAIDVSEVGEPFIFLEDGGRILLENETGCIQGNSTVAQVVSGTVTDTNLDLTHQDKSVTTIDVTSLANVDFEPAGYEYVNDSSLYKIINDSVLGNGLFVEEGEWVKVPCNGYKTNKLPSGNHLGIAGSIAWPGSGSKTYSRIWDVNRERFYFDELSQDTIVSFRFKMDMIPETNNTLVQARINFFAMRDGNDDPVLEDATIVEDYRIVLEDYSYVLDETDGDQIILELGTDMGQGDWPGAYNDTNYKVELETATDGGTGQLIGDHFQAYNFQQTVAAQELGDGAGVEQERTFVFPVYVGDSSSQRGFGYFEIQSTSDLVINDSSILAGLN